MGSQSVTVVAFYDENGSGTLDAAEQARVPDVEIGLNGRTARSAVGTGRAVIDGVVTGSVVPTVNPTTLPPYYNVGRVPTVQVPTTAEVAIPLVLPIGSNRPNTYLAFGDSITEGNNYPGDPSYRGPLGTKLQQHFGRFSRRGAQLQRLQGLLRLADPQERLAILQIEFLPRRLQRFRFGVVHKHRLICLGCFGIPAQVAKNRPDKHVPARLLPGQAGQTLSGFQRVFKQAHPHAARG